MYDCNNCKHLNVKEENQTKKKNLTNVYNMIDF